MSIKAYILPALRPQLTFVRWGVYGCFFFSGATSLIFEVLWSRQFVTVFGNSSYAISIVLCAYMTGLGLGGLFGGRLADRVRQPAAVYGIVQAIISICALAIPPALVWLRTLVPTLSILSPDSLLVSTVARFVFSFAILVVPCFMMGATLPLLVRAVTKSERFIGRRIGALYCLNTLGAALGCFAAGFWMVDTLGLRWMNHLAIGVNFSIAVAAFILSRPAEAQITEAPAPGELHKIGEPATSGGLLLTAAFFNGFAGLACEVLWMRYMALLFSTTYAFSTILCIYLLGMGLGGLIYVVIASRIRQPARALSIVEVLLGLSVPATFIVSALIFTTGPPPPMGIVGMSLICITMPTMLMGVAFPLLCAVYGRHVQTLGRQVGLLFAVNTIGTVLGSLLPVFVLVPILGIQKSILFVSVLYGAIGLILLAYSGRENRALTLRTAGVYAAALLIFFIAAPPDLCQRVFLATNYSLGSNTDILFFREGRTGTAIVTRDRLNNCKMVYINVIAEVPVTYTPQLCFKMIGDLGPMLHANPDEVLMICFGGGIASGATIQLPEVKSLTIVDLERSVVKAAKLLEKENNGLLSNPKARVVIDDGRNYIMTCGRKWPVILSDSTHPKSSDSWVLYTQEFYRLVKEHLTDDGVFVEWVPTQGLRTEEFKIILRTFQSIFPHASLWITHGMDEQALYSSYSLLVATPGPLKIDVAKLRYRLNAEAFRQDLEPYGLHTPAGFLDTFLCAEDAIRRWVGDGPVNTDDLPYTQYNTRYTKGIQLNNADLIEPMEDIWPYLAETGDEQQDRQLHEELAIRNKVNRLVLTGALEKGYSLLPQDVRYRKMRQLYDDGPRYIHKLVGIYWNNPKALKFLAEMRGAWPDGATATAPIYKQILKLDPKNIIALNTLGTVCIDAGLAAQAEDYLRQAIKIDSGFAPAHFNLALLLEKTGRHAEAIEQLQKAAQISNDEKVIDKFGLYLAGEGRTDEAIKWFRRAVEIKPTYTTARLHLAMALQQAGRAEDALNHVNFVLKMDPQNETAISILAKINGSGKPALEDKK